MALIVCPECKKSISDRAVTCPHCGCPAGDKKGDKKNDAPAENPAGNSYLGRLWRGEYPLRSAFWGSFFAVFFAVNILTALFPGVLLRMIIPPTAANVAIILACYIIYASYLIVCVVGVWRSAANYQGQKYLAAAARFFVCCYLLSSLYLITDGFILPLLYIFRQMG